MKQKTIMIPIIQGISYRFLIQTDIFKELQKKAKNIILLVPNPTDSFYEDKNLYQNVIIDDYRQNECEEYMRSSNLHIILNHIRNFVLNGQFDIDTTKVHHKAYIKDYWKNKPGYLNQLVFQITNLIIFAARYSKILRKLILYIENILFTPNIHSDLFENYQPDLLVVTSLGTFNYDQLFMRQAKKRNVQIISVIMSWDNTTTRGYPAAYSDLTIAWTDIMKGELIELNDIDESKIQVGGVALYDHYFKNDDYYSRDDLYDILNINKNLDILFFATKSPNCYVSNDYITRLLIKAINENQFIREFQLLVRLHPIFFKRINSELVYSNFVNEFDILRKENDRLTINKPQIITPSLNFSMTESEIKLLTSILKHSSLLVNVFSSLNIEASIFNIPIVNIAFEGEILNSYKKARHNINQDLNETHNRRIIKSGGIAMVYNVKELISSINEELAIPLKRQEGRQNILNSETGPNHGMAGRKIADLILNS